MILKTIRESKKMSRYHLAKLSGVKESTLQNIENSTNPNPTFKTMCKIADALKISLDDFKEEK
ncbi:helix-turn-helix domain-containing protein [Paraliobacillus sediminis]|uniref:helix-turn-helix domain-containing protein n=1 Tax=Paraliobacillus sediminis TaxID=1885916 RepID=UPI0019673D7E|nr:helix-turn-helix transcriptional regulator [Paraliobacillus sediminis]